MTTDENIPIRRIGLLVPSSDATSEKDFHTFLPDNVSFHTARLFHDNENTPRGFATLDEVCSDVEGGVRRLKQVSPEVVVFSCTSGGYYRGDEFANELQKRIEGEAGVPAILTANAVVDAFKAVGSSNAFMYTPYKDEINREAGKFFGSRGITIADYANFLPEKSSDVCNVRPSELIGLILAERSRIEECDGLFISCTGMRGMEVAAALESELGIPVVTSNSANVWATLRALGLAGHDVRAGQIFDLLPGQAEQG